MTVRSDTLVAALATAFISVAPVHADLEHEWTARLSVGSSLTAGIQGTAVDADGNSYVTGITGSSSNTDVVTASFAADGSLRWSQTYDGTEAWHDQARGIALGRDGIVYVSGNTPGPGSYANVLVLKYDAATGSHLDTIQFSSGAFTSEHAASVAVDDAGGIYITGGTVGDGSDVLVAKFDANGSLAWKQTWDGPAWGPYSQDHGQKIMMAPDGNPVAMIHGVMNSLHPDYVLIKYDATTGDVLWESYWGQSGGDFPNAMTFDKAGDLYVTGTALDFSNRFGTIKLRGTDGSLVWEAYDGVDFHNSCYSIALDESGGVVISGKVDPDGDRSNANDDIYTVRRDAEDGALLWTHRYGDSCRGCSDRPSDVIADPLGHVFVAGSTSSPPFGGDMITLVLDVDTGLEIDRGIVFGGTNETAGSGALRFDDAYNLYNGGQGTNYNTGEVDITVVKFATLAADLYRLAVPTLVGGANATLQIVNAIPATTQYIGYSVTGFGSTPVPPLGVVVDLSSPTLLVSGPANASGVFTAQVPVPAGASGRTVWMQAMESGRTTPVRIRTVR